jgi:hypothetical protein
MSIAKELLRFYALRDLKTNQKPFTWGDFHDLVEYLLGQDGPEVWHKPKAGVTCHDPADLAQQTEEVVVVKDDKDAEHKGED